MLDVTFANTVAMSRQTWLWPGHIPAGAVSLFDGDPGGGKSLLTLDIAARITQGRELPLGTPTERGPVLLFCCEDDNARQIIPRLAAAQADLRNVAIVGGRRHSADTVLLPTLPDDADEIFTTIRNSGAKFVVFDPVVAYMSGHVHTNNDQSVRQALTPLSHFAVQNDITVILVRHLNKSPGSKALYRGGGSIGFAGLARSAFLIAKNPELDGQALIHIKSNFCPFAKALGFSITAEDAVPRIVWGEEFDFTADQALKVADPGLPSDRAKELLQRLLANGPMEMKKIMAEAKREGISMGTLMRVKATMNVKAVKKQGRKSLWGLPQPATLKEKLGLAQPIDDLLLTD